MHDLAHLLQDAMNRKHVSTEAVAHATGIRTPRIRAFLQDGATGPVHPTREELAELAELLALPQTELLEGARRHSSRAAHDAVPS
ncbi:helix-turn-helix domain-containing protein [Streptomyces sp. SID12488]|uniref:helix-turn-helix domain-containing protein n=1 Tax=Streptomyces sp. SID12488 TaxID=2706040 RepID=UPI0013DCB982|nr:helix-turn-helix domain-containing protein [Streptomyces sp. SID12488]NEA68079.1 helix-turn-helix domain-containing protein [Streptomyces sp. SID12488]